MRPAVAASAHGSAPVATAIQVAASISTTFGGVPRVPRPLDHLHGSERRDPHLDAVARAFSSSSCSR